MSKLTEKLEWRDWAIIALVIIIVLLSLGTTIFYHKYREAEAEVVIWNDSTHYYLNKYGEEYKAKNTYILEVEDLKAYNDALYKEYKSLKDNPLVITKTEIITRIDTIRTTVDSILLADGDYVQWSWSAKDSCWYSIKGSSGINHNDLSDVYTDIDELTILTNLTMDVIDDGKQLEVIAKTNNPYVSLGEMQSVVIDPTTCPTLDRYYKPKRWGFGPTLSAGVYAGYDFVSKSACVGVGGMIGFSIHYDIWQW